jgi:hypothetical protein
VRGKVSNVRFCSHLDVADVKYMAADSMSNWLSASCRFRVVIRCGVRGSSE